MLNNFRRFARESPQSEVRLIFFEDGGSAIVFSWMNPQSRKFEWKTLASFENDEQAAAFVAPKEDPVTEFLKSEEE